MNKRQYKEYLRSAHWLEYREVVLNFWARRCILCNSNKDVEVHHRTYERLGQEYFTDAVPLCRACHELHTNFTGNFLKLAFKQAIGEIAHGK